MKIAVTGGAGFIGSHLSDALLSEGHEVYVIDNLSSGSKENVPEKAVFMKRDIRNDLSMELEGVDAVFHLAADPEVRSSATNPKNSFDINVSGTFSVFEACRQADVKSIILASTSTVYGDAKVIPTPEDHPCIPISNYGASKLACEAYVSSYAASYGMKGTSLRLANIFGERSNHGVIFDFYHKLKKNPNSLEILGDGKQDKSYLHVSDCISAILTAWKNQKAQYDVFNVGSKDKVNVDSLARLVCEIMEVEAKFSYTGTKRGWTGDVPLMLLDVSKLEKLGWKQKVSFESGVERYLEWLAGLA
ncbi:MAG: NAD-dependent epimerase/dehydratase family protein [Candidatus ainarchaeum sp.]|nr:NAD-dependent epimerase/dehydratase family protein [Candidatus ainarchaeum sp.]